MRMTWWFSIAVALIAAASIQFFAPAASAADVKIGVLTCQSIPGTRVNLIIHSTVGLDCTFDTPAGSEQYRGESGIALGLDINWERQEKIAYTVLAGTSGYQIGQFGLAGKFVGAKASATAGVGAGAAVLVGGGAQNITLQPLALEASTGIGVAGGIGYLFLAPAK